MPGKDGKRIKLSWCNWDKHNECPREHPENKNVTCDCTCHSLDKVFDYGKD